MKKILYNLLVIFMLSFVNLQGSSQDGEVIQKKSATMSQKLCCCFNNGKKVKVRSTNHVLGFTLSTAKDEKKAQANAMQIENTASKVLNQFAKLPCYDVNCYDVFIQLSDEDKTQGLTTNLLPKGNNSDDYETL